MRTVVIFAHPALEKSLINRRLIQVYSEFPDITFRDLYEEYEDHYIDAAAEQRYIDEAELVILHHPFYWYSMPSLMKEWLDVVLQYGWAYGPGGNALKGKTLLSIPTTGGSREAYRHGGRNRFTIRELLRPLEQTANLCGMNFLPPLVFFAGIQASDEKIEQWKSCFADALRNRAQLASLGELPHQTLLNDIAKQTDMMEPL